MTAMDPTTGYGAGIHWQVAQATSLQNIVFNMVVGGRNNKQQGIFMDNGSANFMGDLIFNGGNVCMFMGNQVRLIPSLVHWFEKCLPMVAIYGSKRDFQQLPDRYLSELGLGLELQAYGLQQCWNRSGHI